MPLHLVNYVSCVPVALLVLCETLTIARGCLEISLNGTLLPCRPEEGGTFQQEIEPFEIRNRITNCRRKIVIRLDLTNQGQLSKKYDYAVLGHVYDPESGQSHRLLNPVLIRIKQEEFALHYPLHHMTVVNGRATERVVSSETTEDYPGCSESPDVLSAQCGQPTGTKFTGRLVNSVQGFCCKCPANGSAPSERLRGGQMCPAAASSHSDESTHCLVFDSTWYAVYGVRQPTIVHHLQVNVLSRHDQAPGQRIWRNIALARKQTLGTGLSIGGQSVRDTVLTKSVALHYQTEKLIESTIPIDYDNRFLLVPEGISSVASGSNTLPEPIKNGGPDYLVLPKNVVQLSSSGKECDKAGVSYSAFYNQPNKCVAPKDACLRNQPLDFWDMDNENRKQKMKGRYQLSNFASGVRPNPLASGTSTGEQALHVDYGGPHSSTLHVTIAADNVTLIRSGSSARIPLVLSSAPGDTVTLRVFVTSGDLSTSTYDVALDRCDHDINKAEKFGRRVTIPPHRTVAVDLKATFAGKMSIRGPVRCTVSVRRRGHGLLASRDVLIRITNRCVCLMYCKCTCDRESSKCRLLKPRDYRETGFVPGQVKHIPGVVREDDQPGGTETGGGEGRALETPPSRREKRRRSLFYFTMIIPILLILITAEVGLVLTVFWRMF